MEREAGPREGGTVKVAWASACAVAISGVLFALCSGCAGVKSQMREFSRMEVGEGPGTMLQRMVLLHKEPGGERIEAHTPLVAREEAGEIPIYGSSDVSFLSLSMSRATGVLHDMQPVVPPLGTPPLVVRVERRDTGSPSDLPGETELAARREEPEPASPQAKRKPEPSARRLETASVSPQAKRVPEPSPPRLETASVSPQAKRVPEPSPPRLETALASPQAKRVPEPSAPRLETTTAPPQKSASRESRHAYVPPAKPAPTSARKASQEPPKGKEPVRSRDAGYRIGPEDVLHLSVWGNPDLTLDLVVRPDGMISVPLIQDVQAGGLTAEELSDRIHRKLLAFIKDPTVSVIVKEIQASRFHVMGYVTRPGSFPLRGDTSVLQALSQAGGFTPFASPRKIRLVRKAKGTQEVRNINYYDMIESGEGNWLLMPGDTIIVQ